MWCMVTEVVYIQIYTHTRARTNSHENSLISPQSQVGNVTSYPPVTSLYVLLSLHLVGTPPHLFSSAEVQWGLCPPVHSTAHEHEQHQTFLCIAESFLLAWECSDFKPSPNLQQNIQSFSDIILSPLNLMSLV